jgi:hypothetical protein
VIARGIGWDLIRFPAVTLFFAANEVGTTRLVIGRTRVRIPPVPLSGTVAQRQSATSLQFLSLHFDGSPRGGGSTEEHEVASLGIRVRFPAAALVDAFFGGECRGDYMDLAGRGFDSRSSGFARR